MASIKANARKVVCIGRNYADHVKELNNVRPKQPFFFLKPPSSILPPNSGPVLRPKGIKLHYEVELALIMGKQVRDLEESDEKGALDAIDGSKHDPTSLSSSAATHHSKTLANPLPLAGYCLSIDLTARNLQDEAKKKGLPWSIAKGFDTFLPISQPIPKAAIPDPHNIQLYLTVNNEVKQQDSTELMLFRIPRMLSDISSVMTLEKGDLVLTGTPKGVGEVLAGDVMRAGVKVNGEEIGEGGIEVEVLEREGRYVYGET